MRLYQATVECVRDHKKNHNRLLYIEMNKKYRLVIAQKKKKYSDSIRESFANLRRPADFWRAVKKFKINSNNVAILPIERWNNFYTNRKNCNYRRNITA